MERISKTGFTQVMKRVFVIPVLLFALSSCLKDQIPSSNAKKLQIIFSGQTIGYAEVDSAFAVFRHGSSSTAIVKKLQKNNSALETPLEEATNETWTLDTYLFTRKDSAGKSSQYHLPTVFNPEQITGILVLAPTNSSATSSWDKSVVLSTADNSLVVTIPLNLTDPNISIRSTKLNWNRFSIEKNAYLRAGSTNQLVATQTWTCGGGCLPAEKSVNNNQAFASFAEVMKTKSWNNADVRINISDTTTNTGQEFTHAWDKPL